MCSALDDGAILQHLENGKYLSPNFGKLPEKQVLTKIEEFSNWFNSQAKLYMMRCGFEEGEIFVYLLLTLKKNIKQSLTIINKAQQHLNNAFTCQICGESGVLKDYQNHEHPDEIANNREDTLLQYKYPATLPTPKAAEKNDLNSFRFNFDVSTGNSSPITNNYPQTSSQRTETPENDLNSFRFNFSIEYDKRIEEALYPDILMVTARKLDKIADYTIQRCGPHKGYCLLCPCNLGGRNRSFKMSTFVIKNHASGNRHLKLASTDANTAALKKYHNFWKSQDVNYQAHQVHFTPEPNALQLLRCNLCNEFAPFDNGIVEHIKAGNHKTNILKLLESKQNEYYLLDLQVGVYDIVINNENGKNSPHKEKEVNNVPQQPMKKCIIRKCLMTKSLFYLPERYMEHRKFFAFSPTCTLFCSCCKAEFYDDPKTIKHHVLSVKHRQSSKIKYKTYDFYCEICNMTFKDEFTWEEHFERAPPKHSSVAPTRKRHIGEFECDTCLTVIFGDDLSLSRHISQRSGNKKNEIVLPLTVKKLFRSKAFIEEEGLRLQNEAIQVLEYQDKTRECCEDLQNALSSLYPNCRAYPFGSRISGIGNNQSDLDIYLDTGDMYIGNKMQDPVEQKQLVEKSAKIFKSQKDMFCNVFAIPLARTPIVKLQHCYTKLDCDVSFRHGLGVENTRFLRYCMDLQPITQRVILLLKKWSSYCNLNEYITNYGLAIMAIFYLQVSGFLMSVHTIRQYNPSPSLIIDGWETINYTVPIPAMKKFIKPYPSSLKQLLREMFYYYATFDYANNVICPLLGHVVPKMLFCENPGSLPPEMRSYVQRVLKDGEIFRGNSPFCIQDPFDLSHNLTKACQHSSVNKLKTLCKLTFEFLDSVE